MTTESNTSCLVCSSILVVFKSNSIEMTLQEFWLFSGIGKADFIRLTTLNLMIYDKEST